MLIILKEFFTSQIFGIMQQSIREEENENRKFFNLYLDQFQDWDDLASLEC